MENKIKRIFMSQIGKTWVQKSATQIETWNISNKPHRYHVFAKFSMLDVDAKKITKTFNLYYYPDTNAVKCFFNKNKCIPFEFNNDAIECLIDN